MHDGHILLLYYLIIYYFIIYLSYFEINPTVLWPEVAVGGMRVVGNLTHSQQLWRRRQWQLGLFFTQVSAPQFVDGFNIFYQVFGRLFFFVRSSCSRTVLEGRGVSVTWGGGGEREAKKNRNWLFWQLAFKLAWSGKIDWTGNVCRG